MTDGATFRYGGVSFPLPPAGGGNGGNGNGSLLSDADPAVYWALDFFASMLTQHIGTRLVAEATACGATDITSAVAYKVPYDAAQHLATQQFKFPLLAVFRISDRYSRKTSAWSHDEGRWGVQYILPPLTDAQIEALVPILNAAGLCLQNRTEQGHDPSYQSDARVWRDLAKIEQIGVISAQRGSYEAQSGLLMPAWLGELSVSERMFSETGLDQFAGTDGTIDLAQSDGSAAVNSFVQITKNNVEPLAWLDARQVTQSGGVVTSAANLAPGRSSFLWTPGAVAAPTWSPTGFKGGPGLVWPGDVTRRLTAAIASSFAGTPPAATCAFTAICAVQNNMAPAPARAGTIVATYRDTDVNSGYVVNADRNALPDGEYFFGLYRFDEVAAADGLISGSMSAPCVLTAIFDGSTYTVRINGQAAETLSTVSTGAMLAQDFVAVGALSDAEGAFFGNFENFVGSVQQVAVFPAALSGAELSRWESLIATGAGLSL